MARFLSLLRFDKQMKITDNPHWIQGTTVVKMMFRLYCVRAYEEYKET